ncbi:MAG: YtxH domain-containing protein [Anaerolineales bacterium]
MINESQEPVYRTNFFSILISLVVGGAAGAITMLLLAPQSGRDTRIQIQEKGIELRDRTSGIMEDAMAQVRLDRNKLVMGGRKKAKELINQGQALAIEQLERVSEAAQTGKKAIQNS